MAGAFKKCFKCGLLLPISMFYAHREMADGHLNKCKNCAKADVHKNYLKNIENEEYVEKERIRGREKYKRLNYCKRYNQPRNKASARNSRRFFEVRLGKLPENIELHHWNYNEPKSVFILDRRTHARLHKLIERPENSNIFVVKKTREILDTIKKHKEFIMKNFPLYTIF